MIKMYFGLSGTFKETTIKSELNKIENVTPIWSMIKYCKHLENDIFTGQIDRNNILYAIQHLSLLKHIIVPGHSYIIERGVTDMAFYHLQTNPNVIGEDWIKSAVKEESNILGCDVEKILLVQKDEEFIKNVVLKEKTRAEVFPAGVSDFISAQESYIDFTRKFNDINKVVVINDSKDYLENVLNVKYIK